MTPQYAILKLYELISGPADEERKWDDIAKLFWQEARLRATLINNDQTEQIIDLTVKGFAEEASKHYRLSGFWEKEISSKVETYGNISHIFSIYETRLNNVDSSPVSRGINSVQVIRKNGLWKIASIIFQKEQPECPIPKEFMKEI